ncbi:MAG: DUF2493 domain-containing protein [Oscillospiraceae bacterium]|nr:DUF2493 domain-containing protein [Oscillospiraceae bacterium]
MSSEKFDVIIAGSRGFDDYAMLVRHCDYLFSVCKPNAIISGTARGADTLGERYAKERGIPVQRFPAQWDKYGKRAGYLRNQEMLDHADALIAAWDGKSRGTAHMIEIARQKGIPVRIIKF